MATEPAQQQFLTLGEAAGAMSERLAREGGGLAPEFETQAPTETREPEPEAVESAETQEVEEEQAQETPDPETGEERFELPETAEELAEMLGIEVGDLYGLSVGVSVGDGVERLTVGQMKDRVTEPLRDEVDRRQWLDAKRAQEQQLEAERTKLGQQLQDANALGSVVFGQIEAQEKQLTDRYNGLLGNVEFQTRDPQAYQVELMRAEHAVKQVQAHKQGLIGQMQQIQEQQKAQYQRGLDQAKQEGVKRLRNDFIPEWKEDESFNSGAETLSKYILQDRFGITADMLEGATLPALYYFAEMARRYESLQESARNAKPKAIPAAKLRPGAPKVKLPQGRKAELEAMDRLKASGDVRDAQAALLSRLQQS